MDITLLGWVGCGSGMIGALLISFKIPVPAFIIWLGGSFVWITYGYYTNQFHLVLQSMAFACLNIIGIKNWRKKDG